MNSLPTHPLEPVDPHPISDALRRDLALVLPPQADDPIPVPWSASIEGSTATIHDALARAATLCEGSHAPAIVGLSMISMQAAKIVVPFAKAIGARLLPLPTATTRMALSRRVSQHASIDEALSCDFVIKPGVDRSGVDHPVAAAIAQSTLHSLFVEPGLDALLGLRAAVRDRGAQAIRDAIQKPVTRLCVLLPPGIDAVEADQWHALAAEVQCALRVSVLSLPDMTTFGNARGVSEVIAWQTGMHPADGGVDLADPDQPRICEGAESVLRRGATDLPIFVGLAAGLDVEPPSIPYISIGEQHDERAAVSIAVPGLRPGYASSAMRCDGVMVSLCDDLAAAPPDPTAAVLTALLDAFETRTVSA